MKLVGMAWVTIEKLEASVPALKLSWLSLLCPAGYLFFDKEAAGEGAGLVIGSSDHELIILKVERVRKGRHDFLLPKCLAPGQASDAWYFKPVTN